MQDIKLTFFVWCGRVHLKSEWIPIFVKVSTLSVSPSWIFQRPIARAYYKIYLSANLFSLSLSLYLSVSKVSKLKVRADYKICLTFNSLTLSQKFFQVPRSRQISKHFQNLIPPLSHSHEFFQVQRWERITKFFQASHYRYAFGLDTENLRTPTHKDS